VQALKDVLDMRNKKHDAEADKLQRKVEDSLERIRELEDRCVTIQIYNIKVPPAML
jgi:hypothetical protein